MSPRPQIDHIRKPQILAAAIDVIGERGVAATRISDIAEQAGTSPAAVLYWFDSKESLLAEALILDEQRFYEQTTALLAAEPSASRRLALLIEAAGDTNELWIEIWTRALRQDDAAETRGELDRRWRASISEVVTDGLAAGEFSGADPDEAAATLGALMDGLAVQVSLEDPEMPRERMVALTRAVAERLLECKLPAVEPAALAGVSGR